MKVCLINNLYKPYTRGGAEKVLELIYQGFVDNGHAVFVISTEPRFSFEKKEENYGYRIKSLYYNLAKMPIFFRLFWHFFDMFDFLSLLKINRILKKEKPDLVITNNLKGVSFLVPSLLRWLGIKHVHVLHDMQLIHPSGLMMYGEESEMDSFFANVYSVLTGFLFSFCTIIISPSQWLLDQHLRRGFFKNSRTEVVPNPAIFFKGTDSNSDVKKDIFQFLYVGQVEEYKGVELLIKAFDGVKNAKLGIVGDGSYIIKLKEMVDDSKNIILYGRKSKEEVLNIMFQSDCLIVPSLCYENSPTVIYEAMTVGLPIIASKIGGITEFINEIGGILFQPGDEKDLRVKMEWAIKNPQELEAMRIGYAKKISKYYINEYMGKLLKNVPNV